MDDFDFNKKKLEYTSAQEMLRHYDSLNWQIGSILIAATIVLTGLVLKKEDIDWVVVIGVPLFSYFILHIWFLWFKRHRELYNYRNETLHRLEIELGFYHYLRVVEADLAYEQPSNENKTKHEFLMRAREQAGYDINQENKVGRFTPFYTLGKLSNPSGFTLVKWLKCGIPIFQCILFLFLKCESTLYHLFCTIVRCI